MSHVERGEMAGGGRGRAGIGSRGFVDKKNAVTYTLVAAPAESTGDGSGRVFMRTDSNTHLQSPLDDDEIPSHHPVDPHSSLSDARREEIRSLGLPDDGYDYLQHVKHVSGGLDPGSTIIDSSKPVSHTLPHDAKAYDARNALTSAEASALPPRQPSDVVDSSVCAFLLVVSLCLWGLCRCLQACSCCNFVD